MGFAYTPRAYIDRAWRAALRATRNATQLYNNNASNRLSIPFLRHVTDNAAALLSTRRFSVDLLRRDGRDQSGATKVASTRGGRDEGLGK